MFHFAPHSTLNSSTSSLSPTSPALLSSSSPNPDLLSTHPYFHCEHPRQDGHFYGIPLFHSIFTHTITQPLSRSRSVANGHVHKQTALKITIGWQMRTPKRRNRSQGHDRLQMHTSKNPTTLKITIGCKRTHPKTQTLSTSRSVANVHIQKPNPQNHDRVQKDTSEKTNHSQGHERLQMQTSTNKPLSTARSVATGHIQEQTTLKNTIGGKMHSFKRKNHFQNHDYLANAHTRKMKSLSRSRSIAQAHIQIKQTTLKITNGCKSTHHQGEELSPTTICLMRWLRARIEKHNPLPTSRSVANAHIFQKTDLSQHRDRLQMSTS